MELTLVHGDGDTQRTGTWFRAPVGDESARVLSWGTVQANGVSTELISLPWSPKMVCTLFISFLFSCVLIQEKDSAMLGKSGQMVRLVALCVAHHVQIWGTSLHVLCSCFLWKRVSNTFLDRSKAGMSQAFSWVSRVLQAGGSVGQRMSRFQGESLCCESMHT